MHPFLFLCVVVCRLGEKRRGEEKTGGSELVGRMFVHGLGGCGDVHLNSPRGGDA